MGWDGVYLYHKPSKEEELKYIEESYIGDKLEIVQASKVGNVWYIAVRNKKENRIFALVVLTSYRSNEYLTKAMTEDMNPYYFDAPLKLLKILSPTDDEYANKWRDSCMQKKLSNKTSLGEVPLSDTQYMEIEMENKIRRLRKTRDDTWYTVNSKRSNSGYRYTSGEENLKWNLSREFPNTPAKVTKYNENNKTKEVMQINDFSELRGKKLSAKKKTKKSTIRKFPKLNVEGMF